MTTYAVINATAVDTDLFDDAVERYEAWCNAQGYIFDQPDRGDAVLCAYDNGAWIFWLTNRRGILAGFRVDADNNLTMLQDDEIPQYGGYEEDEGITQGAVNRGCPSFITLERKSPMAIPANLDDLTEEDQDILNLIVHLDGAVEMLAVHIQRMQQTLKELKERVHLDSLYRQDRLAQGKEV